MGQQLITPAARSEQPALTQRVARIGLQTRVAPTRSLNMLVVVGSIRQWHDKSQALEQATQWWCCRWFL